MKISDLIKNLEGASIEGENIDINHLAFNTSKIQKGSLFFCIEGVKFDGHVFAQKAILLGAKAIVISKDVDITYDVTKIKVKDTREAMAIMSSNFYNDPAATMDIIGITGTNGKTTSTFMLKSIFDFYGKTTGLMGTIFNISGNKIEEAKRTTPESLDLHEMFQIMKNDFVNTCIMEVSSHSLVLKRVYGIRFKVGILTNVSQDHLDFHDSMDKYFDAKMKLFENCERAVINIDDDYGKKAINKIKVPIITYGIDNDADVKGKDLVISGEGTEFKLCYNNEVVLIRLSMPGKFNVYNALGCAATAICMGVPIHIVKTGLEAIQRVPGRSEKVKCNREFTIVIDYAHSPDGIINILKTAREYTREKLIILFGCGGDRDITKRSLMGKAAGELSDFCIVTSDNPRSEDPNLIIEDIIPGIKETNCPYVIIADRREAIKYALENAKIGDVIIIAGKGHETYQELAAGKIHFDEREIISELLREEI
jgi:UDP-N-acetylmuramoyl-L-alanyl-D-glutamate--2,6-diaminopimelate ligase